jgi:hypothetical protein
MNDRDMNRYELTKSFAYESKCRAYLERLAGPRTPNVSIVARASSFAFSGAISLFVMIDGTSLALS